MTATLIIAGLDISRITIYDVKVECGRDDVESQASGSVLTASLIELPSTINVGDPVSLADDQGTLFHGFLTDLRADLDSDIEGMTWGYSLTATGPLAALGYVNAGLSDYPQESDSQRVARVLTEAGAGHNVDPAIPGPQLLPRLAQLGRAQELARNAANDGQGVLWENPADPVKPIRYTAQRLRRWAPGDLAWAELPADRAWADLSSLTWADLTSDYLPAEGFPPAINLDPATIPARATFTQQIGDLGRTVVVTYGTPGPEGARPTVTVGEREPVHSYDTQLATFADASTYAGNMLRRSQEPAWRLASIAVPLHELPADEQTHFRDSLTVGTKLTIPFPLGSPVGYLWEGFLEGWTHALTPGEHSLELRTSERSLTEPSDRWQDIAATITWAGTDPAMRWQDAAQWREASR
jgi:hypothetical protein